MSCIFGSGHLVVKCLSSRVFSPLPSSFSDTFPPLPASYLREISAIRRNNFQSCWTSPFDCQRILSTSRRLFLQLGSSQDRRATRRRGWPTMNDAWHNLLGISETTWSIVPRACAMTRLSDFNSIGDQISNKLTTTTAATTYERVRATSSRHLGYDDVIVFVWFLCRCRLLPVRWPTSDEQTGNAARKRNTYYMRMLTVFPVAWRSRSDATDDVVTLWGQWTVDLVPGWLLPVHWLLFLWRASRQHHQVNRFKVKLLLVYTNGSMNLSFVYSFNWSVKLSQPCLNHGSTRD